MGATLPGRSLHERGGRGASGTPTVLLIALHWVTRLFPRRSFPSGHCFRKGLSGLVQSPQDGRAPSNHSSSSPSSSGGGSRHRGSSSEGTLAPTALTSMASLREASIYADPIGAKAAAIALCAAAKTRNGSACKHLAVGGQMTMARKWWGTIMSLAAAGQPMRRQRTVSAPTAHLLACCMRLHVHPMEVS